MSTTTPTSARGALLLSTGAQNGLAREAAIMAGDAWIARRLVARFTPAGGAEVGYATSPKIDAWAAKRNLPPTYAARKRAYQGHSDPGVWSGRMRFAVLSQAHTTATATQGQARGTIRLGRLDVSNRNGEVRQLPAAHPARRLLTVVTAADVAFLAGQSRAWIADRMAGMTATRGRIRVLPPAPIGDRQRDLASQRAQRNGAASSVVSIAERNRQRRMANAQRIETARQTPGGSAPIKSILGRVLNDREQRSQHNSQSRQSYARNRASILARRRARRAA